MVIDNTHATEKVTFNIPIELKEEIGRLKEKMNVSFSYIYNDALREYIKKKEMQKWEEGIEKALNDKALLSFVDEIEEDSGELYEY